MELKFLRLTEGYDIIKSVVNEAGCPGNFLCDIPVYKCTFLNPHLDSFMLLLYVKGSFFFFFFFLPL